MVRKVILITISTLFLLGLLSSTQTFAPQIFSDDVDKLEEELKQTKEQKAIKEKILKETEAEINTILNSSWSLSQKISALEEQINSMEEGIASTKKDIKEKESEIQKQEKQIVEFISQVEELSRRLYKNSRVELLTLFISESKGSDMIRSYVFKKYTLEKHSESIEALNKELGSLQLKIEHLNKERVRLEAENEGLASSKEALAGQQAALQAQYSAQNAAKGSLQSQIGSLNSKITKLQEAILLARSGAYVPSVGSVPSGSDIYASAKGFRDHAPAGSFATFSFGAYTHRKGMSQYGALARAEKGQDYSKILKDYYGKSPQSVNTSGKIKVEGAGSITFDGYYLYGIAEMPSHWPLEALKAQAVAARTYAYSYYKNGNQICTTEACQVFLKSKADNPPANWKKAVDQTKGKILPGVVTYYSSTSGGYLDTMGWDTTNGKGGSGNWTENAYESLAKSPWFYKAWYRNGYSDTSSSCGRMPWMSEEEMADIINTWLVMKKEGLKGSVDESRILPVTVNSCAYVGLQGNPYSHAEMRNLLQNPVTSISGYPGVSFSNSGQTTNVLFNTNRGVVSIPGSEFKGAFNTRAPGYLAIPQSSFTFFNIERK